MKYKFVADVIAFSILFIASDSDTAAVTIETVLIGSPNNPADTRYANSEKPNGYGSVDQSFWMGKTKISNTQYAEFLNAVAESDPYSLYDTEFGCDQEIFCGSGIVRTGHDGSYSYAIKGPFPGQGPGGSDYTFDNNPVTYVSFYDAIRFTNWLHNGQGSGDTEDGAYTLLGGSEIPSNAGTIARNSEARWWLPNEDEWYKAAYYDQDLDLYHEYPTGTSIVPNNNSPANDTGNSANYLRDSLTAVGAYSLSGSPFGTFDQGGNVWEWTETLLFNTSRRVRGGDTVLSADEMRAAFGTDEGSTAEFPSLGFRVASTVPEPSALLLSAIAALLIGRRRRRWRYGLNPLPSRERKNISPYNS